VVLPHLLPPLVQLGDLLLRAVAGPSNACISRLSGIDLDSLELQGLELRPHVLSEFCVDRPSLGCLPILMRFHKWFNVFWVMQHKLGT
jgi:hypothetical protein